MNKRIKALLTELKKNSHVFWNISPETGLFLNQLIRLTNAKTILEIGTSNGVSGIWMAEALAHRASSHALPSHTKGHLYTIESHKRLRYREATKNFAASGLAPYVTQILGHAPEAIPPHPEAPRTFDLIFLDATKYEHKDYLKAILPRTHKNSIIITDNALSHKKELAPYVKTVRRLKNFKTFLLPVGTGLLISIHC